MGPRSATRWRAALGFAWRGVVAFAAAAVAGAAAEADSNAGEVWRAAEDVEYLPVGAEVQLSGREMLSGTRGIAFTESGTPYHIEKVALDDIPSFLERRTPSRPPHLLEEAQPEVPPLCSRTFLLNDPRVGLFHNQRLSYEVALLLAKALDRTLVLPGFFKFPHPDAWAGTQWVPVRELFDWGVLQRCYEHVIEIGDLIAECGHGVLDEHAAVGFLPMWMQSTEKAPWINATRPELVWAPSDGGSSSGRGEAVRLQPALVAPEVPIGGDERIGVFLHALLQPGVASARTVRAHGVIANNVTMEDPQTCFFPNMEAQARALALIASMEEMNPEPVRLLAIHLRIFKRETNTSGGYLPPELAKRQGELCNFEPKEFQALSSLAIASRFSQFVPTHTYVASNEANETVLSRYFTGFPGHRRNPFTPAHYDAAITVEDSREALMSILVDAVICGMAHRFIGNVCSTMSQYIATLRHYWEQPRKTISLLGGDIHSEVLQMARDMPDHEAGNGVWVV